MDIKEAVEMGVAKLAELSFDGKDIAHFNDSIYSEPTNIEQMCYLCGETVKKREMVVKQIWGCRRSRYPEHCYAHLSCYLAMLIAAILKLGEER